MSAVCDVFDKPVAHDATSGSVLNYVVVNRIITVKNSCSGSSAVQLLLRAVRISIGDSITARYQTH
jgi:hypothetical protein